MSPLRPIVAITPLGSEVVLPAVVVGFDVTDHPRIARDLSADVPDGVFLINQQAGGYCMRYPSVLGFVLRLEGNLPAGDVRGPSKVRGLKAMAEDPDFRLLAREHPALVALTGTHGDWYSASMLAQLYAYLWGVFGIPPFKRGFEAFVEFDTADPLEAFRGWRLMHCRVPERLQVAARDGCLSIEGGGVRDVTLIDRDRLGEHDIARLKSLAPASVRTPLSAFLLWENCD